jgi:hypothetical protein
VGPGILYPVDKDIVRDVEYILVKGKYNFKALTPAARQVMGEAIGGPWKMAADVFFMHVLPEKLDSVRQRLQDAGLRTEDEEKFNVSDVTDF